MIPVLTNTRRGEKEYTVSDNLHLIFKKTSYGWFAYLLFGYMKKSIFNLTQCRTPPKGSWSESQFRKDYIKHEDRLNKAYIEIVFGDKKDIML